MGAGQPWHLTLQEAVNIAMSNSEAVRNLGLVEAASRNDLVRSIITTYDPLAARSEAQAQWGIFDPLWTTNMIWNKQDIPPGTSFSGIGNRPPQLDTADFDTSIEQLLPVGTRIRAEFVTDYLFNPDQPPLLDPNPQYFSYTQFGLTQPLCQGFGVDVTMAPIKIACAEAERTDWQFKQEMLALVRSIETTYWELYAQQQNLRAIEELLPNFREVVRVRQEQATTDVGTQSEVARAQSELYLYEQRRLEALSRIAEQQLVLRNLMGVPPSDCRDIRLLAVPVTTKPFETLCQAVQTAVSQRPDVLRQRLAVYVAQQERVLADNAFKPRLDFNGYWRTNGLGENLDESYDVLGDNDFNDWQMGVFFQMPLGRRQARGELRAAEYRISRERAMLEQTAHQASYEVADAYRRIHWVYQQLEVARNRQEALGRWSEGARAQFESPPPGMTTVFALELYLQNLRDITDASISANALLAEYNSALARLEEVKGTLLENRLVEVAGDSTDNLPPDLPRPEIQLPESVQPTPNGGVPEPAPLPAQPAPQPAPPQGAQEAPPISQPMEIAQQPLQAAPLPLPAPELALPESVQAAPEAVAETPIVPETTSVEAPAPPADGGLPMEIAQEPQWNAVKPLPTPSLEMPQSVLPDAASPDRTAMRPTEPAAPSLNQWMPEPQQLPAPQPLEPAPVDSMERLGPLPPAMLAMPDSVRPGPIQDAPKSITPIPLRMPSEGIAEQAPRQRAPAAMVARPAPQATTKGQQQAIRMPESIKAAPSRLVAPPKPAPQPTAEAEPPVRQPLPQASIELPHSIQPAPAAAPATIPAPAVLLAQPAAVQPEPHAARLPSSRAQAAESSSQAWSAATAEPTPLPTLATPMQLPDSIRAGQPPAAMEPAARMAEAAEPAMAQPTMVAQAPIPYGVPRQLPPSGPQLQMPASVMAGAPRLATAMHAPTQKAPNENAAAPHRPNGRSVVAAKPIAHQAPAPMLQFPASVEAANR